jgi:hypothetical protein
MRPSWSGVDTESTPFFFEVWKSCSRSGMGTSSMRPFIAPCVLGLLAATCSSFWLMLFESISRTTEGSLATSFKMEVPMRMRSPSLRRVCLIFSPLTNVPLVLPRSWMVTLTEATVIFACLRETMSSTRTMSSSLDRPITTSLSTRRGNSPPWYLPEMNLRAKLDGVSLALGVVKSSSSENQYHAP